VADPQPALACPQGVSAAHRRPRADRGGAACGNGLPVSGFARG